MKIYIIANLIMIAFVMMRMGRKFEKKNTFRSTMGVLIIGIFYAFEKLYFSQHDAIWFRYALMSILIMYIILFVVSIVIKTKHKSV